MSGIPMMNEELSDGMKRDVCAHCDDAECGKRPGEDFDAMVDAKLDHSICWNENCVWFDTSKASRCEKDAPPHCECQFEVSFQGDKVKPSGDAIARSMRSVHRDAENQANAEAWQRQRTDCPNCGVQVYYYPERPERVGSGQVDVSGLVQRWNEEWLKCSKIGQELKAGSRASHFQGRSVVWLRVINELRKYAKERGWKYE